MFSWREEASQAIEELRKIDIAAPVLGSDGNGLSHTRVQFRQVAKEFPFGAAIGRSILINTTYQRAIEGRFNWAVFGNESKWYANEAVRDREQYSDADAMLDWCEARALPVRGHCIFWEPEKWQPNWLAGLSSDELRDAVERRLEHAVTHFKGRFRHWDVNNEMLHGQFFRERLGADVWAWMFRQVKAIDPEVKLFVNDFNILSVDQEFDQVQGREYVDQINRLLDAGAPVEGIGIQGHVWHEDLPARPELVRQRLDEIASVGLPIWITEFDVAGEDPLRRADTVEVVYRTAYSHPAVEGIMTWVPWGGDSWRGPHAGFVNEDGTINEAGQRFDLLMDEWSTDVAVTTDELGIARFRGFPGTYEVSVGEGREPAIVTVSSQA